MNKKENHHHSLNMWKKNLLWVRLPNFSMSLPQVKNRIISNNLSLISDAIHNLGNTLLVLQKEKPHKLNTYVRFGFAGWKALFKVNEDIE